MSNTKNVVRWGKAVPILIGKNRIESDESIRTSKCGRYTIKKRMMASSQAGCWAADYVLEFERDGKAYRFELDRLGDARAYAEDDARERLGLSLDD